jgi:hypothetical protein
MSGLSWSGFTIEDWIEEFEASTTLSRRESKKALYAGAKEILAASKQMAPVDEGDLEAAHTLTQVRLNEDFSEVEIDVGGFHGGREVDDYAVIVHETMLPFGSGSGVNGGPHLGPKSVAKDIGNPSSRRVGGKFLERAVDLLEQHVIDQVAETLPGVK